tara:strand:- start:5721 stop:6356 length:636 start_codon:yes stop_codon:yes gene_type:complete
MAKRARAKRGDPIERIITAALTLSAQQGWRDTRMTDIADTAGVSLQEIYALTPTKMHIVAEFLRKIDSQLVAGDDPEMASEPPRDRLFDVIMRRFDLLGPYKEGVASILNDARCRPYMWACAGPIYARSLTWMLESARIDHSGISGLVRVKGLGLIMLAAIRVWLSDDSADLAKTMTFVDRQLSRADRFMATFCHPVAGRGTQDTVTEASS